MGGTKGGLSFQFAALATRLARVPVRVEGDPSCQRAVFMSSAGASAQTGRRSRLPANVPGDFYVNAACIDCDTCRWFAPDTFARVDELSYVYAQPETREQRLLAQAAAVACPTGAIRTEKPSPETREARSMFPLAVNDERSVFYLGYTSEGSFAASSWLLLTPTSCIMIDVPRFNSGLAKSIERLLESRGRVPTVDYIVLSHRDDVDGHELWAKRFPTSKRVIHKSECNSLQRTDQCEVKLEFDKAPTGDRVELTDGVSVIHVPGHTEGSIAVLDRASQSLFTGDHLFYSTRVNALFGSTIYIRHSWRVQQESVAKLAEEPFLSIYPGHGRMHSFSSAHDRRESIAATVSLMAKTPCRVP
jgi:glyoxylase-like metal-dependent hydrolase (beta-lactamase superfamily II)/ferredoxin